jgi:hypothetical protein
MRETLYSQFFTGPLRVVPWTAERPLLALVSGGSYYDDAVYRVLSARWRK